MGLGLSSNRQYETIPDANISLNAVSGNSIDETTPSANWRDFYLILQSYFWPDDGKDSSALINRARSTLTWIMVVLSKICSIISPIYLSYGTDNLVNHQISSAIWNILMYCTLRFLSFVFKGWKFRSFFIFQSNSRVPRNYLSQGETTSQYPTCSSSFRSHSPSLFKLAFK